LKKGEEDSSQERVTAVNFAETVESWDGGGRGLIPQHDRVKN